MPGEAHSKLGETAQYVGEGQVSYGFSFVFLKLDDARLSSKLLDEIDQFNRVPIVLE